MAEMADSQGHDLISADAASIYDEDGGFKADFLEEVKSAIDSDDADRLVALAGGLHEADLGALLAAVNSEQRFKLVELMGAISTSPR